ncbi:PREDICTED: protein takeout-like [Drosophila arizonae]|uniref:Protein takeout-like n=1 Tax=Drosophila arizonae TaxID=7263 RepID=A0ABM1NUW2_DROAR|nr:PREDICTED: protein takeout-like [Drosophila arizonae]
MHYIALATICLWASGVYAAPAEPKYLMTNDLPKCPNDADHAGECIKIIMNELIPRLRLGDPELGIEPYDPFVIDRLSFQYSSGAVNGKISVRNVKLYGFAEHKIKDVNVKVKGDKVKLRTVSEIPKMNILGDYKAELQVNSLQLKPKGTFNLTLSDVENRVIMDGEFYTKDGLRFLRLKDIEANPTVRDLVIKANGIFGDPELDELALSVANNYWRDIYGIILPETRQSWAPVMLRLINEALQHVPIDQFIQPPK